MLPNRLEHVLADLGVLHAGGVPVTFYATLAADQIAFMAANCDAKIAVIDGAGEFARWQQILPQLPSLHRIIVRDAAACPAEEPYLSWDDFATRGAERLTKDPVPIQSRIAAIRPEDAVTLLYTSGTTGNPKGVIITHANALYEVETARPAGTRRCTCGGCRTCRWRISPSGCSRCTWGSATPVTPTSATTRRRSWSRR